MSRISSTQIFNKGTQYSKLNAATLAVSGVLHVQYYIWERLPGTSPVLYQAFGVVIMTWPICISNGSNIIAKTLDVCGCDLEELGCSMACIVDARMRKFEAYRPRLCHSSACGYFADCRLAIASELSGILKPAMAIVC